ncbi:MAG: hypothetical protein NTX25_10285, partial [Proteobacteria bacterium]|nr:hypothetical protein [Pseudomonadota bacterium]
MKKEEVDILTAWVKEIKLVTVVPLSESDAINLVRKDLETNVAAGQRSGVRYFSLHVPQNLGATAATLGLLSQAFSKVINSISRAPMIIEPKAIDKNRLLYRIQLSDLAMNEAAFEKVITNYYPFGKDFTAGKNNAGNRRTAEDHQYLKTELGTEKYLLRADWFVATATLPQLYSEFLQLGADQVALQTQLGVNQIQNILDNKVIRSGFKNSNVSSQNRVIERHLQTNGLAYWLSYDFASNEGKANIFSSPLGPIGSGNDARSFAHDGGEMIFQLPNGMLAYYLANAAGVKIDKGPTSIVRQADAPVQFSTAILNGVSCMNCHGAGLLHKVDEVRNFSATLTDALTADEMTKVRNLFVEEKTFKGLLDKDNAIHFKALSVIGINPALPDPVNQGYRYYNRSLSRADVREELGFSEAEFAKLMTAEPFRTQWSSLNGSQGYIKRDELQGFLQQALELHTDLALPINPLIGDAVITPQCMFANPLQTNGCLVRIPPPPPAPD